MANPGGEDDTYYRLVRELAFSLTVIEMQRLVKDVKKNLLEIERKLERKRDREEFLNRMKENAAEFQLWIRKREARKDRRRGGGGGDHYRRRSETEEDSEEEDGGWNPVHHDYPSSSEEERIRNRRRENLFRMYWKEKTKFPRVFRRTMIEPLPEDEESSESSEELEDEDADEEMDEGADEEMDEDRDGSATASSGDDPENYFNPPGEDDLDDYDDSDDFGAEDD